MTTTNDDDKLDNMTVRRFAKLIKGKDTKDATSITTGKVLQNDNVISVAVDDETIVPIEDTGVEVNVGDEVTVGLADDSAYIISNNTDKSAAISSLLSNIKETEKGFKLELADKASKAELTLETDNLTSRISSAEGNIGTLTTRADEITGRVESAEGNIGTLTLTANSLKTTVGDENSGLVSKVNQTADALKSEVSTREGQYSTITQTAEGLQVQINNASVGRNLVRSTSSDWSDWIVPTYNATNQTHLVGVLYYSGDIAKGDSFTSQVEVEFSGVTASSGKTASFKTQGNSDGAWTGNSPWTPTIDLTTFTTGSKKYTATYTYTAACSYRYSQLLFRVDNWASGKYRYRRVKVEKGNKATDWSKAPEDTEQAASNAQTSANTAQTSANTAQQTAEDAKKVATNYLSFNSTDGLVVGDMTTGTLGCNTQIKSAGMNIRNGSTVLASFEKNKISLGNNSSDSKISMCGGQGTVSFSKDMGLDIEASSPYASTLGTRIRLIPDAYTMGNADYSGFLAVAPEGLHYYSTKNDTSNKINYDGEYLFENDQCFLEVSKYSESLSGFVYLYTLKLGESGLTLNDANIYGETVLYNNTTGTTGAVTLRKSAANFTYLEIHYKCINNTYGSVKVYDPNGKKVQLQQTAWVTGTTTTQTNFETVTISGTTISRGTMGFWQTVGTYITTGTANREFTITRVIGIK